MMEWLDTIKSFIPSDLIARIPWLSTDVKQDRELMSYPQLLEIKPNERYIFHGDYFEVDKHFAVILSFFHTEGATDNFPSFWGINRIPSRLGDDIVTVTFEQIRRMTDGWISERQSKSEGIAQMNTNEQQSAGTNTSRGKSTRKQLDLQTIAMELQDGASYLSVHYRLLVKAPTLEKLDQAVLDIDRLYVDRFGTLVAAPFLGEQRMELSTLFSRNEKKKGKPFYFTSTELAGSYSLVTHGLEDPNGEYVGYMVGDVNSSAVLFNVDGYKHHIVVANEQYNEKLGRAHVADMWGSKVSQAALLSGRRVVHLVLDGAKLDQLGPKLAASTHYVNMNSGDVNMFELFGDVKDELSVFSMHMEKLRLMTEQMYETTSNDRGVVLGKLEEIATDFYVDRRMWYHNAQQNRDKLRVVGVGHDCVPRLEDFVMYLATRYKAMLNSRNSDPKVRDALHMLWLTYKNMLSNNNDLFNTTTNSVIDDAKHGKRVIYDFSDLIKRGQHIAMAQFVNILGYAVSNLTKDDVVILHGAELIKDNVKPYTTQQFASLLDKGGRVCYLYNNIEKMIQDKDFNTFDKADYTILGNMTDSTVMAYQTSLGQQIPPDLAQCITHQSETVCYIRRGFDNVVFKQDLALGLTDKTRGLRI